LQGLQEVFDLKPKELSWITCGYMGAIGSGQTTCGLLISAAAALGLACGKGKSGTPEENETERARAIALVNELYRDFIDKFHSTECKTLLDFDFSIEEPSRFIKEKIYENKCDTFMDFIMNRCMDIAEQKKIS